jgi:hypothetical protein
MSSKTKPSPSRKAKSPKPVPQELEAGPAIDPQPDEEANSSSVPTEEVPPAEKVPPAEDVPPAQAPPPDALSDQARDALAAIELIDAFESPLQAAPAPGGVTILEGGPPPAYKPGATVMRGGTPRDQPGVTVLRGGPPVARGGVSPASGGAQGDQPGVTIIEGGPTRPARVTTAGPPSVLAPPMPARRPNPTPAPLPLPPPARDAFEALGAPEAAWRPLSRETRDILRYSREGLCRALVDLPGHPAERELLGVISRLGELMERDRQDEASEGEERNDDVQEQ